MQIFILLFKKVLNFLLPFVRYSVEIVCIVLNFVFQYSAQQKLRMSFKKAGLRRCFLYRNKINPETIFNVY